MNWDREDILAWTVVDHRILTEYVERDRMNADAIAIDAGMACELIICPNHHTLQGIETVGHTPGTPRDFNAGIAVKLRDGCWLV